MKRFALPILLALYVTLLGGWVIADLEAGPNSYQSDTFSIELPADLIQTEYPREDGQTIVVFDSTNADEQIGFQVFTQPYDGALTVEILKQEIPDIVVDRTGEQTVDGEPALKLYGYDPDIGDTFEVWFVHDGLLYQATTYRQLKSWLTDILRTWRFR